MAHPASSTDEIDCSDLPPLLLHFDVNKTMIITDSIMNKSTEYTIREIIANHFWGESVVKEDENGESRIIWKWDGRNPSTSPAATRSRYGSQRPSICSLCSHATDKEESRRNSAVHDEEAEKAPPITYLKFLRSTIQDQSAVRLATRSFELVLHTECKQMMLALADKAARHLEIPAAQRTEELEKQTGLVGEWRLILPSVFRLIAQLQRQRRHFAVVFRSFGTDLQRVSVEWNAFCEGRHPLVKDYMEGVPRMDGSVPGVPDRRLSLSNVHTMYRDAEGPLLALHINTNGQWDGEWDQWARSGKQVDTRRGRAFLKEQGLKTVCGYTRLQGWFKEQVMQSRSNIIREDFSWWHYCEEVSSAGKLMIGIDGVQQLFFDDNIGIDDLRIVDARYANSFLPVPPAKCIGQTCIQVDTLQAILSDDYFIDAVCSGEALGCSLVVSDSDDDQPDRPSLVALRAKRTNSGMLRERRNSLGCCSSRSEGSVLNSVLSDSEASFGHSDASSCHSEEEPNVESSQYEPLVITDLDALRELLSSSGVNVSKFGAPGTTYKTVENLHQELIEKKCCVKRSKDGDIRVQREMEVMRMKLMCNNLILVETHEQLPDGRLRSRNGYLPATKKRHGEKLEETIDRWAIEELQIAIPQEQKREAVKSCQHKYDITAETMSYPLPCSTHYLDVCCRLQPQEMPKSLLDRLGLPAGSMFSTRGMKKKAKGMENEAGPMRFWSWYPTEVWEAMTLSEDVALPEVQDCVEELFKGHSRRDAYASLLLQMFDCFSASKLCGGLSGSMVLQVQPVDPIDGKNDEAVIVKLDKADVISREIANSKRVWNRLSDRAARIFGQGCFYTDTRSVEYGAFKIELAGGCWQVPELAGGSRTKDLLMTFKDLLAIESQRQLLDTDMHHLVSTSGDVELVLFELLGPGGMLRVLHREPLARSPRNLFHSFVYAGKDTKWNPLYVSEHFQLAPMQELWRRSFGKGEAAGEMPDVRVKVQDLTHRFAELDKTPLGRFKPIIGLAHGDLNAMNVLIDVMDAVWLIDFAFSEEKPLCWDLAKLEVAFMFEYAVLPVSWRTLLDFAGETEEDWKARKVHSWLGVSEPVAYALLEELLQLKDQKVGRLNPRRKMPPNSGRRTREPSWGSSKWLAKRCSERSDTADYPALQKAILRALESCYKEGNMDRSKEKKRCAELCRLCAVLVATREEEEAALEEAAALTRNMLHGDTLQEVMDPPTMPPGKSEGASLSFCWSKVARLRRFYKEEWTELRFRAQKSLGAVYAADESPLVHWLGLLQESYRLLGYFDVAPWVKVWAVFFLECLTSRINGELDKSASALSKLPDLAVRNPSKMITLDWNPPQFPTKQEIALRILAQRGGMPSSLSSRRRIRLMHSKCPDLCDYGGVFAEVRGIASVTVDDRALYVELVRFSGADEESTSSCGEPINSVPVYISIDEGEDVPIGALQIPFSFNEPARLMLSVPLVPLSYSTLAQQDRRRGVRAFGETANQEQVVVIFGVAETAFCYPEGQRLSVSPKNIAPLRSAMRLQFVTVLGFNERTGYYSATYDNMEKNVFEDTEIDPFEGNHLKVPAHRYGAGAKLTALCRDSAGSFVDVIVAKSPTQSSARHLVIVESDDLDGMRKELHLDLNGFNHAKRNSQFASTACFEETRRYRVFAKAKHSVIYTVSSERADVLEGPVPRIADETGREVFFWSEVQTLISEDDDRLSGHIFFHGILILGEPGSGKSCLLCKLAMHCLSHSTLLLPVLIPVLDLCSRLQKAQDVEEDDIISNDAEELVDWYLCMVYGDTTRFYMLRQALATHRLLLLFDGIDEAGPLTWRIERCITGLVAACHRVVATARLSDESESRPNASSPPLSWLKTAPQLFRVMELLPMELECRKSLVEVLLAREPTISTDGAQEAVDFIEDFIMHLDEDEGRKWSTPMMISMLVASWREKKRQDDRRAEATDQNCWYRRRSADSRMQANSPCSPMNSYQRSPMNSYQLSLPSTPNQFALGIDIREVYRVALDLLIRRFQSRRQADRHKMKDMVQKFKELLEIIAEHMAPGSKEFTEADVLPLLSSHSMDIQVWNDLSEAIREGRVPFLQMQQPDPQDSSAVSFMFTYASFQRFLSSGLNTSSSPTRSSLRSSACSLSPHSLDPNLEDIATVQGLLGSRKRHKEELKRILSPRRLSTMASPTYGLIFSLISHWGGCCFGSRTGTQSPREARSRSPQKKPSTPSMAKRR